MATELGVCRRLGAASLAGFLCIGHQGRADESGIAAFAPTGFAPTGATPDITPGVTPAGIPSDPNVRIGDIRGFVNELNAPAPVDRPFTFTPSIGVQELVTDNVFQVAKPRQADVVTTILPQLVLSGQTQRVQANITYAPSIQLYAKTSQQNQVAEDFNGQALLTAIPDTLFLELRGYGVQQSAAGNFGQNGLPYYSNQNRTNIVSLEASPYVTHRFGGDGSLQAGYVFNYSSQTGNSPFRSTLNAQPSFNNVLLASALGNSLTRSNEEYATFTTGENLGRFNDSLRLDTNQYNGTGSTVLTRAHRTTAIDYFGYGINRTVALLGSAGYEDIAYAGVPPVLIQDAVWSGGVRLTPNETSTLTASYGHKDGFNSFTFNASYAVTARLRVFANYSEGLTSSAEELQDNLDNSTVDQYGNTISTVTGAPTLVTDQLLALQNDLYRLHRLSATAISTYARDVFTFTVEQDRQQLVASASGLPGYSDHGTSVSASWSRDLTPDLTGAATLRYSHTTEQTIPVSSFDTVGLFLQTNYAFSPSLTGTLEYFVTNQSSNASNLAQLTSTYGQSFLQNAVIIGLRKTL